MTGTSLNAIDISFIPYNNSSGVQEPALSFCEGRFCTPFPTPYLVITLLKLGFGHGENTYTMEIGTAINRDFSLLECHLNIHQHATYHISLCDKAL